MYMGVRVSLCVSGGESWRYNRVNEGLSTMRDDVIMVIVGILPYFKPRMTMNEKYKLPTIFGPIESSECPLLSRPEVS